MLVACLLAAGGASHIDDADVVCANGVQAGAVLPFPVCHNRRVHLLPAGALVRGVPNSQGEGGRGFQEAYYSGEN